MLPDPAESILLFSALPQISSTGNFWFIGLSSPENTSFNVFYKMSHCTKTVFFPGFVKIIWSLGSAWLVFPHHTSVLMVSITDCKQLCFGWMFVHFPSGWFLLVSKDKEYMHAHMLMFLKGIVMKDWNAFCCLSDQTLCLRAHQLIYSCVIKRIKSVDTVTDHSTWMAPVWSAKDETIRLVHKIQVLSR